MEDARVSQFVKEEMTNNELSQLNSTATAITLKLPKNLSINVAKEPPRALNLPGNKIYINLLARRSV